MSRICVKNLPKHVDEEKLKELFSEKGEVTDAKLVRTPQGKSRQFAFVGFRTEDQAHQAIRYFDQNFIHTCRISCELARRVGDPDIPRPWSRHTKKKKKKKETKEKRSGGGQDKDEDDQDDDKFKEFLEVMKPRAKSKLWANDDTVVVKNMEYFKSSRIKKEEWSDSQSSGGDDDEEDEDEDELEGIDTCRLFVRNLPYTATEDELEEHFSTFGSAQVNMLIDKETNRSKGIAYVHYTLQESAQRALKALDNSTFQGRLLHVMPAKQKNPSAKQRADDSTKQAPKSLKQQREEKKKAAEASGDTRAWNSLFIRPQTAVDIIARKYGVSKSEFLDADDAAVRVAQAQTQVIALSKKGLTKAGVNVESLEILAARKDAGMKRSNHIILVKNLPDGSSEGEVSNLFGKFGNLDRVIMPSPKTFALIVFFKPSGARAAFKGLHYKKYMDVPLYLEWAPANILSPSSTGESTEENSYGAGVDDVKMVVLEQFGEGILDDLDTDRVESRTLYVKNLNFKTSDESLKNHFSKLVEGKILSAKVKKHLKNGKNVSMGFGFVEFDSVETAKSVCKYLQRTTLDRHQLILQHTHAKQDERRNKVVKDKSSAKLIVKNVAFEATIEDLHRQFSTYGEIKSLRLPETLGQHRGFAFVEFATKQEADSAIRADNHLYGRHLILERAKGEESLEELRARTGAQLTNVQNVVSRKRKAVVNLDEGNMKFERFE